MHHFFTQQEQQEIKLRLAELERQRRLTLALELELRHYLKSVSGFDLEADECTLDIEHGVLTRAEHAPR